MKNYISHSPEQTEQIATGFFDYLDYGGILAIEWSENIEAVLPPNTITVTIQKDENDPDLRRIQIDRP